MGFSYTGGIESRTVVFNAFRTQRLTMSHIGLPGSLLAPYAEVRFTDGALNGSLFAASLRGNGQVNNTFARCDDNAELDEMIRAFSW